VTLQSSIEAELPYLRAEAEALMRDTCRVTRPADDEGDFNPETGKYDALDPVVVYEGRCRIPRLTSAGTAGPATAGDATWQVGEYPLALPVTDPATADIRPGDTVNYLTAADNVALVDCEFGIVEPLLISIAKDRRFKMKSVVS
jgi:hypothetical protein